MTLFEIRSTDTLFLEYADVGPDCTCSRCGRPILRGIPIRAWRDTEPDFAYRFHPECLGGEPFDDDDEDGAP
jgi:hypothetical protein